ncbi:hypothetical protein GCM10009853_070700 [Glycomyces scopariae]
MAGWVTFAAVAVAAGIGAVALAQGGSLAGPEQPMSEDDVLEQLADVDQAGTTDEPSVSGTPTGAETTAASEAPPTEAGGHVLGGDGGTFMAVCEGDEVRISWWTPAQGWNAAAVDQGPGPQASVTFTAAGDDDDDDDGFHYIATCTAGVPAAALQSGDDDNDD